MKLKNLEAEEIGNRWHNVRTAAARPVDQVDALLSHDWIKGNDDVQDHQRHDYENRQIREFMLLLFAVVE